jgi:hypothetical protein
MLHKLIILEGGLFENFHILFVYEECNGLLFTVKNLFIELFWNGNSGLNQSKVNSGTLGNMWTNRIVREK